MTPVRILIAALTTLRLTRFSTSDFLGEWLLVGPAKRWAWRETHPTKRPIAAGMTDGTPIPTPDPTTGWRSKLVKGLDCSFCVGFWLGALVLLAEIVAPRIPVVRHLWRFAAGALALNYVTGHISARIDG